MTSLPKTTRLDLLDSYRFDFEATILEVRRREDGGCEAALDQTAFYVESGGQPADCGSLAGHEVAAVREEDGIVWHALGEGVEPEPSGPLRAGLRVSGRIDSARRLDHMRQHTGQHILSAAFVRAGERATAGFHLGREESTIDLAGPQPEPALLRAASEEANRCVLADRSIRVHQVDRAELDKYPLRRDPGAERDILRLIEIEGYDWSACGGTHARRSGETGPIQILGVEKIRSLWRVRFLVGERALSYWASAQEILQEVSRAHSIHWRNLPQAAADWREESARLGREVRRLVLQEAVREAERLSAGTPEIEGVRGARAWVDGLTPEGLKALATQFVSLGPAMILVGTAAGDRAHWAAARSAELPPSLKAWHAGEVLRSRLGEVEGKGGGSAFFAQGTSRIPSPEEREGLLRPLS